MWWGTAALRVLLYTGERRARTGEFYCVLFFPQTSQNVKPNPVLAEGTVKLDKRVAALNEPEWCVYGPIPHSILYSFFHSAIFPLNLYSLSTNLFSIWLRFSHGEWWMPGYLDGWRSSLLCMQDSQHPSQKLMSNDAISKLFVSPTSDAPASPRR